MEVRKASVASEKIVARRLKTLEGKGIGVLFDQSLGC